MKILNLAGFLIVAATTLSAPARADTWNHRSLQSRQGLEIQLAYQTSQSAPDSEQFERRATPVFVRVFPAPGRGNFRATDSVRVVLNTYVADSTFLAAPQVLDLQWDESSQTFAGKFAEPIELAAGAADEGVADNRVTISVVADGQWQSNPLPDAANRASTSEFDLSL